MISSTTTEVVEVLSSQEEVTCTTTSTSTTTESTPTTTKTTTVKKSYNIQYLRQIDADESTKLTLNIFDFDGTLFRSPEPNPAMWHTTMLGKLKALVTEPGGLGWFQETVTLDHPYVPEAPELDWFNKKILDAALLSSNTKNNITVLLTGRTALYQDIIKRILKSVSLNMNHIGLKPIRQGDKPIDTTFQFKEEFITELLEMYGGRVNRVVIYEDRKKHAEKFEKLLEKLRTTHNVESGEVVLVLEPPRYLTEELETELVNRLVTKNGTDKFKMRKMVSYTCALLDHDSHHLAKSWFELPEGWELKCHHTTMNLGAHNPALWRLTDDDTVVLSDEDKKNKVEEYTQMYAVGQQAQLKVVAVGLSGAALALKVSGVPSNNKLVHITVAHHPRAKPVESNNIINWTPIEMIEHGHVLEYVPAPVPAPTTTTTTTTTEETPATPSIPAAAPSTPGKQPFEYPAVSIKTLIHKDGLVLNATIKEIGPITYESVNGGKDSGRGGNNRGNNNNNKQGSAAGIPDLLKKHHPSLDKKNFSKAVQTVRTWVTENDNCQDVDKLEQYIKGLSLNETPAAATTQ
ncbi:hypothetical protein SAMD00019534_047250 [Acytostelium subglobosum LB1]|uniref:hypothetical protein n=1 Tax=Acytostelium subglobosum LB1 TaxID=1410327 RepID=UPI000644C632|nr:hypothetical protein SAMD00019534_047250 [Acytostelium subglobosum LB1]GAM21550.1 hypothetical protein SAMD00019534_047250 [Acytostelium subglobosum LB1]|eukprot:XP_012755669.1 hypothetical protein SAMD00019534_047250 [Acytostelium subglobosum LB1]